jgi:hypothetical protein
VAEQNTEQTIMVRQVTDVHSNWSIQGPGILTWLWPFLLPCSSNSREVGFLKTGSPVK